MSEKIAGLLENISTFLIFPWEQYGNSLGCSP